MGELIGALIALPFVFLSDWFGWIRQQSHPELTKACHGAGMMALLGYAIALSGGLVEFIAGFVLHPDNLLWIIALIVGAWGLGWFLLYARHAALSVGQPYRATMIVRALIKLGLGWGAWVYAAGFDRALGDTGFVGPTLRIVAVWCLATGAAKFLLMLWGKRQGRAQSMVTGDIAASEFDWNDGKMR
jgi:hypothetical protein